MDLAAIPLLLLAALPKVEPKPIPWLADGSYAPESAVYEVQCAKELVEICQVLSIDQYSGWLVAEGGVLSHVFDGELSPRIFLPDAVTAESAEGVFAEPAWPPDEELEYRGKPFARVRSARVRLWRVDGGLVVRWVSLDGARGPRAITERYVPESRLAAAAAARARGIGVSVSGCSKMGKLVPPRFATCPIDAGAPRK